MKSTTHVTNALLEDAATVQLAPYEAETPRHKKVHPLTFTVSGTGVAGQLLPRADQPWISVSAFTHLTDDQKNDTAVSTGGPLAMILRRRMRFLELLVELSLTRQCAWQECLSKGSSLWRSSVYIDTARDDFNWSVVLHTLTDSREAEVSIESALASMRWTQPRFLIEWNEETGRIPDHLPSMLETFLGGLNGDSSVDEGLELPKVLQTFREESGPPSPNQLIVVELGLLFSFGNLMTSTLFQVLEVLEQFGESSSKKRQRIEFRVVSFQVLSRRFATISGGAFERLSQYLRTSKYLHFKEIQMTRLNEIDGLSLQRSLTDLTSLHPTTSATSGGCTSLKRLFIEREFDHFARLGSTVRYASTIEEIDVWFNPKEFDALAAWLAFGFFHCDSPSRVTTLCLRPSRVQQHLTVFGWCTSRFTEIFKRVLSQVVSPEDLAPLDQNTLRTGKRKRGGVPVESAIDEEQLPQNKRVFVTVAKTKARAQPTRTSPVVAILMDDTEEDPVVSEFQVVRQLRGWLAIVVPGWGAGWIDRRSVVTTFTLPTRVSHELSISRRLTSFTWEGREVWSDQLPKQQQANVLVDLMELIGGHLKELQLPRNALDSHHLGRIVDACPNLRKLNLFGNIITDIAPLVRAYEQGTCNISGLVIAQDSDDRLKIIEQCTQILDLWCDDAGASDHQRPPIEQLVVNIYRLHPDQQSHFNENVAPAFVKALRRCPTLELVRLLGDSCRVQDFMYKYDPESNTSSEDTATRASRPLPLASKIAMLSAVHHSSTSQSAIRALGHDVLTQIFSFARPSYPCFVQTRFRDESV